MQLVHLRAIFLVLIWPWHQCSATYSRRTLACGDNAAEGTDCYVDEADYYNQCNSNIFSFDTTSLMSLCAGGPVSECCTWLGEEYGENAEGIGGSCAAYGLDSLSGTMHDNIQLLFDACGVTPGSMEECQTESCYVDADDYEAQCSSFSVSTADLLAACGGGDMASCCTWLGDYLAHPVQPCATYFFENDASGAFIYSQLESADTFTLCGIEAGYMSQCVSVMCYEDDQHYSELCQDFVIEAEQLTAACGENEAGSISSTCCDFLATYSDGETTNHLVDQAYCSEYFLERDPGGIIVAGTVLPAFVECDLTVGSIPSCDSVCEPSTPPSVPEDEPAVSIPETCSMVNYPLDPDDEGLVSGASLFATLRNTLDSTPPLFVADFPECMDAWAGLLCSRSTPKRPEYYIDRTGRKLYSQKRPICKSVCDEVLSACYSLFLFLSNEGGSEVAGPLMDLFVVNPLVSPADRVYDSSSDPVFDACNDYPQEDCFLSLNGNDESLSAVVVDLAVDVAEPASGADIDMEEVQHILGNGILFVDPSVVVVGEAGVTNGSLSFVVEASLQGDVISANDVWAAFENAGAQLLSEFVNAVWESGFSCHTSECSLDVTVLAVDGESRKSLVPPSEVAALQELFDTCNGENWERKLGWGTDVDVCAWQGVLCDYPCRYLNSTHDCDFSVPQVLQHVIRLDLAGNNLICDTIPASISDLSEIRILDIGANEFSSFQETIGDLSKLEELYLYECGIYGTIPSTYGQLSSLHTLFLGERPKGYFSSLKLSVLPVRTNDITDATLGVLGEMSSLKRLDISSMMDLDLGAIPLPPALCELSLLEEFNCMRNTFSGDLPECIFAPNLSYLFLDLNQFSGTVPSSAASSPSLVHLTGMTNRFDKLSTEVWCSLPMIRELSFSYNRLVQAIPSCVNYPNLRIISMFSNQLSGTLPESLVSSDRLAALVLPNNQLSGTIPEALANREFMFIVWLDNNQLSGSFPIVTAKSHRFMTQIGIGDNLFDGSLPTIIELGCLEDGSGDCYPRLERLNIGGNSFTGTIPSDWTRFSSLTEFEVYGNALSGVGQIPCSFPGLTVLDLSDNLFSEDLSEFACFGSLSSLERLRLSHNQFTGTLPSDWGSLGSLLELDVGTNQITGGIPSSYSGLNIMSIDLSNNRFDDDISRMLSLLGPIEDIQSVNFAENLITGSIMFFAIFSVTEQVFLFEKLTTLILYSNDIGGPLLESIGLLDSISTLDVRNNYFTGEIETQLENLDTLLATGNPYLVSPDASIPSFAAVDNETYISLTDENFACPRLTHRVRTNMVLEIDSLYFGKSVCRCRQGYYGTPESECHECLHRDRENPGASCPGDSNPAPLIIRRGWYPVPPEYYKVSSDVDVSSLSDQEIWDAFPKCTDDERRTEGINGTYACIKTLPQTPLDLVECDLESRDRHKCNPHETDEFSCREGYTGRLCSKCEIGYYQQGRQCIMCSDKALYVSVFLVVGVFLLIFYWLLVQKNAKLIQLVIAMKGLLFYLQTTNILWSKTSFSWPKALIYFDSYYSYSNFSISVFACITDGLPERTAYYVVVLLPLWISLLSVVALLFGWLMLLQRGAAFEIDPRIPYSRKYAKTSLVENLDHRTPLLRLYYSLKLKLSAKVYEMPPLLRGETHFLKALHCIFYLMNFLYLPVTVKALQALNCTDDPVETDLDGNAVSYLLFYPDIECDMEGGYRQQYILSILCIVFFVIGIPVFFGCMLYFNRHRLSHPVFFTVFSFLFAPYKVDMFWFEIFIFGRRLALAITITAFKNNSGFIPFIIFCVLAISLFFQISNMPFHSPVVNSLELIAMAAIAMTYFVGFVFSSEVVNEPNALYIIEILIVIVNVLVLLSFFIVAVCVVFDLPMTIQGMVFLFKKKVLRMDLEEDPSIKGVGAGFTRGLRKFSGSSHATSAARGSLSEDEKIALEYEAVLLQAKLLEEQQRQLYGYNLSQSRRPSMAKQNRGSSRGSLFKKNNRSRSFDAAAISTSGLRTRDDSVGTLEHIFRNLDNRIANPEYLDADALMESLKAADDLSVVDENVCEVSLTSLPQPLDSSPDANDGPTRNRSNGHRAAAAGSDASGNGAGSNKGVCAESPGSAYGKGDSAMARRRSSIVGTSSAPNLAQAARKTSLPDSPIINPQTPPANKSAKPTLERQNSLKLQRQLSRQRSINLVRQASTQLRGVDRLKLIKGAHQRGGMTALEAWDAVFPSMIRKSVTEDAVRMPESAEDIMPPPAPVPRSRRRSQTISECTPRNSDLAEDIPRGEMFLPPLPEASPSVPPTTTLGPTSLSKSDASRYERRRSVSSTTHDDMRFLLEKQARRFEPGLLDSEGRHARKSARMSVDTISEGGYWLEWEDENYSDDEDGGCYPMDGVGVEAGRQHRGSQQSEGGVWLEWDPASRRASASSARASFALTYDGGGAAGGGGCASFGDSDGGDRGDGAEDDGPVNVSLGARVGPTAALLSATGAHPAHPSAGNIATPTDVVVSLSQNTSFPVGDALFTASSTEGVASPVGSSRALGGMQKLEKERKTLARRIQSAFAPQTDDPTPLYEVEV